MYALLCVCCLFTAACDDKPENSLANSGLTFSEIMGGGTPEYKKVDYTKRLQDQRVVVDMGERVFNIPKVYLATDVSRRGQPGYGTGINLTYVMPGFMPKFAFSKEKYDELYDQGRKGGGLIHIDSQRPTTVVEIVEIFKKEKYDSSHVTVEYGLKKYVEIGQARRFQDMYVEEDKTGKVVSFLFCSILTEHRTTPQCEHTFTNKHLRYRIGYNRKNYLPTWREHRATAIAFMDSFEIPATQANE